MNDSPSTDHNFEILFDHAEPSAIDDVAYSPYGQLGFPKPPEDRPWIYTNFVQSLDGITTLLGAHASGGEISQSSADRWLMDLLRAHADGLLMGMNTLREEQRLRGPESRGIVFRVVEPELQELRRKLGKGRERNIFVTSGTDLDLSRHKVFDGDVVDAAIVTSPDGAERLHAQGSHPHLTIIAAGQKNHFDLARAIAKLREDLGIQYLLCEGGPTLYGSLARLDLIDEKFLTVSPVEVGQLVPQEQERLPAEMNIPVLMRPTVFGGVGFTREDITHWHWMSCRKARDHQFSRYRTVRAQRSGARG
ncbi:MAG TPA: dihydrofolate reductase family protein [Verrucomicrobiae bacterium]|jgi:riboflavin biosynthesis pyrimidine reductase|nr:dihydrofolate reductase family protein [Verrucomicrobiae bacterium]